MGWKQQLREAGSLSQLAGMSPSRKRRSRGKLQLTAIFNQGFLSRLAHFLSAYCDRVWTSVNSDHGWYYQQPFAWMDEYNAALLEPDPMQANRRIRQALRAIVQRKNALEKRALGSAEWNLLQYAELVLRHIGKEGILFRPDGARQQPDAGVMQVRKAA